MVEWIDTSESSTITRIGYDSDTQTMTVEFKKSATYNYFDVPPHVFAAIRNAPSKGQYLAQQIKGTYRYARA
jgi:KTSC domain